MCYGEKVSLDDVIRAIDKTKGGYEINLPKLSEYKKAKPNSFLENLASIHEEPNSMNYCTLFRYDDEKKYYKFLVVVVPRRINLSTTLKPRDGVPDCFLVLEQAGDVSIALAIKPKGQGGNKYLFIVDEDFKTQAETQDGIMLIYRDVRRIYPHKANLQKIANGLYAVRFEDRFKDVKERHFSEIATKIDDRLPYLSNSKLRLYLVYGVLEKGTSIVRHPTHGVFGVNEDNAHMNKFPSVGKIDDFLKEEGQYPKAGSPLRSIRDKIVEKLSFIKRGKYKNLSEATNLISLSKHKNLDWCEIEEGARVLSNSVPKAFQECSDWLEIYRILHYSRGIMDSHTGKVSLNCKKDADNFFKKASNMVENIHNLYVDYSTQDLTPGIKEIVRFLKRRGNPEKVTLMLVGGAVSIVTGPTGAALFLASVSAKTGLGIAKERFGTLEEEGVISSEAAARGRLIIEVAEVATSLSSLGGGISPETISIAFVDAGLEIKDVVKTAEGYSCTIASEDISQEVELKLSLTGKIRTKIQ